MVYRDLDLFKIAKRMRKIDRQLRRFLSIKERERKKERERGERERERERKKERKKEREREISSS